MGVTVRLTNLWIPSGREAHGYQLALRTFLPLPERGLFSNRVDLRSGKPWH